MRFKAENYEKAFPRDQKKTTSVEVASKPGNVIEEAEQEKPEPEEVSVEIAPDEIPGQEGASDGNE